MDLTPQSSTPWWSLLSCCRPPASSETAEDEVEEDDVYVLTQKGDDLASTMKQRFSPPGEMGPDQEMISLSKFYYKLLMLNVAQVRYNVAVYVFDINPHISLSFLIINKCNPSYRTNPSP